MRTIRASMLPSYSDCARRAAAQHWREMIEALGYELRSLAPSIGSAVGTAAHAGVEHLLRSKIESGRLAPRGEGLEAALERLRLTIAPGAEWDETTPTIQVAEFQIGRILDAYLPIAEAAAPLAVELDLRADLGDGWELTGHVDLIEKSGRIDDLKTGAVRRPYQSQIGGYSLLAKSNGLPVSSGGITFVPRGKKTRPQPPAERQTYDLEVAERAAWATVQAIRSDFERFEASGDPYAFQPNPMSMMCSKLYCPAWGTSFCRLHMPEDKPAAD